MKLPPLATARFFFATAPLPCPYLPGRVERRLVTELAGRDLDALHHALSLSGFRRSHGVAYAPACPDCEACVPVRVAVDPFRPSRTQRRIWRNNRDLTVRGVPPRATREQYRLFSLYQDVRHNGGDMGRMDFADYEALVEDSPVETGLAEFREPAAGNRLVAVCLVDRLADGLSAVYSFFDPDAATARRSPGVHVVLWLIERARALGLPYVYLGFWVAGCRKMSYKVGFRPIEVCHNGVWARLDDPAAT